MVCEGSVFLLFILFYFVFLSFLSLLWVWSQGNGFDFVKCPKK